MIDNILKKSIHGKGDSDKHLLTLFSIAVCGNCKTIVELGVRGGDTTLPLYEAVKINNGFLYSVDIDSINFNFDGKYWKFIKSDAIEFLKNWDKNIHIDLVFIDDWHVYDHVKKELEILGDLVSSSSLILLHDLMYNESCPFYNSDPDLKEGEWANGGPYRAVNELDKELWEFSTLPWNNGLTILRKKEPLLLKK